MSNARRPARPQPARSSARPPAGAPAGPGSRVAAAQSSPASRRLPLLLGVLAVVVVAGVIALLATRGNDDDAAADGVAQTAPVAVVGTTLPAIPEAAGGGLISTTADPAVGKAAPVLTGTNFAGAAVTAPAAGQPTVVMFVAHWCPHCQREVPLVQQWRDAGRFPADVQWRTVSTSVASSQDNYPPSAWLTKVAWTAPVIADSSDTTGAKAYGLTSFPYFVVVGADGNVKARATGELELTDLQSLVAAAKA